MKKVRVTVTTFHGRRIVTRNNITTKHLITANFKGNRSNILLYQIRKIMKYLLLFKIAQNFQMKSICQKMIIHLKRDREWHEYERWIIITHLSYVFPKGKFQILPPPPAVGAYYDGCFAVMIIIIEYYAGNVPINE